MKNKATSILRQYTPIVKKKNYLREKNLSTTLNGQMGELYWQIAELNKEIDVLNKELDVTRHNSVHIQEYSKWVSNNYPKYRDIINQRLISTKFKYRPLISIILPVYNTKPDYLEVCINSVIDQSYVNWELCIVDDASDNQTTLKVLDKYEKGNDSRIHISHSSKNGHISTASNIAIDMATGEFVALLDHDDLLWPNALYEVVNLLQTHEDADLIYSDEDKIEEDGDWHKDPYFKPDWSPHLLECINYITHFSVIRRKIINQVGGFDKHLIGSQDWDLFLRISEITDKIYHVPTILYSWRIHQGSTSSSTGSKSYVQANQRTTLENHLKRSRSNYTNQVLVGNHGYWYVRYDVIGKPLVSIIIPTKDKVEYLKRCVDSIINKTSYSNYEIIIVDTGSKEPTTQEYYAELKDKFSKKKLRISLFPKTPFNYSDACNFGAKQAKGEYLLMLNNDTEVRGETWIGDMLGYAQQQEIAAVGVKLLYPTNYIQHAGVTVGIGSNEPVAGHPGINQSDINNHNINQALYTNTIRDVSAVTAACLLVATSKFWEVKGFNSKYRVTFNDVDLCLKFRKAGYHNIYLPFVELTHDESISVGRVLQNRDMNELNKSAKLIRKQWKDIIDHDPYYNPNFHILSSNFGLDVYSSSKKINR